MSTPLSVLNVEDVEDDALLLVRELRRGGYEPTYERVQTADAMRAALAKQRWDIVIADYNMPSFSGLAALELLKDSGLDLPFILVSGAIGEDTAVEALKAGAHDFVMKGNLARLVPAIKRELREAEVRREHRRAEEEITRLSEFNEEIVQKMEEGVLMLGEDGMIAFLNPKVLSMLGYTKDELIGRPFSAVYRSNVEEIREHLKTTLKEKRSVKFGCVLVAKDGKELTILASCTPLLRGEKFTGYLFTMTDMTEQNAIEEALIEKGLKYNITKGNLYLSEETAMDRAMDAFQGLLKANYKGMVITRRHPDEIKEKHHLKDDVPVHWLGTEASSSVSAIAPEFPIIEKEVRNFLGRMKVVLLDRLEYLTTQKGFEETLAFVQRIHELAYASGKIILISLDPAAFLTHQLALLRSESQPLERKEGPSIPLDLLEILKFVQGENREGRKPTHKEISKRFSFSRMTCLTKLKQLQALGLIADEQRGRMKLTWVTEKGKDLL